MIWSVCLTVLALAVRVLLEYLSKEYENLTAALPWCNYVMYALLAVEAVMVIVKVVKAFRTGEVSIVAPIIATAITGAVYVLFRWLGGKYAVCAPFVPWIGYSLIGMGVNVVIFIIVLIIVSITGAGKKNNAG